MSESTSAARWHEAVREASARTTHALAAAPRDPRYASDDASIDRLWGALHDVADPELPISLVDLGLICGIRRLGDGSDVEVEVTFTATACPCMEFIVEDVRTRLLQEPDVEMVRVRDLWDPPWTVDRMTAHGRALLKSFGVAA